MILTRWRRWRARKRPTGAQIVENMRGTATLPPYEPPVVTELKRLGMHDLARYVQHEDLTSNGATVNPLDRYVFAAEALANVVEAHLFGAADESRERLLLQAWDYYTRVADRE